jgi:putative SOS response-associated peptidase YedK
MCHRYTQTASWQQILQLYQLPLRVPQPLAFQARYNIAPFQKAPVLWISNGGRRIVSMHWGLTPEFSSPRRKARRGINVEVETLATACCSAWQARRCLVLASGFYEWRPTATPGGTQPHLVRFRDWRSFSFGGVWESSIDPVTGKAINCFAIITAPRKESPGSDQSRLPLIINRLHYSRWLTAAEPPVDLLQINSSSEMIAYPVSRRVNSPTSHGPGLTESINTQARSELPHDLRSRHL